MINTEWRGMTEWAAIDLIFSRMTWYPDENERRLRVVAQNNFDCIFEIVDHINPAERKLKLISVCKIDNLHTDKYKTDSPHYFKQPYTLQTNEVTERLIRMNQNYKTAMQHALNLNEEYKGKEEFKAYMLEQVQQIDYGQVWGKLDSYFAIQVSFTLLDWLIIETAIRDE